MVALVCKGILGRSTCKRHGYAGPVSGSLIVVVPVRIRTAGNDMITVVVLTLTQPQKSSPWSLEGLAPICWERQYT